MTESSLKSIALRLAQRELALRQLLARPGEPAPEHEVTDFKDAAAGYADAQVLAAEHMQWEAELGQVLAAQHRLKQNCYGICLGCAGTIDTARLQALPEAAFCTACQDSNEHRPAGADR